MEEGTPVPTLYDIIGVQPTATQDEIKRAYRKKAMQLHPDRNPDDPEATEKFQQLSDAYDILKDPAKRERYDKFGNGEEQPTDPEDVELFEMMTQIIGLGRSRAPPSGDKVSPSIRLLPLKLEDVFKGGPYPVTFKYHRVCHKCHGIGSTDGVEYPICPTCKGAGSLSPGGLQFLFPCRDCDSTGYLIPKERRCPYCRGRKVTRERKKVTVQLEPGVVEGDHIVIPKEGDEYPGKESADIVFVVSVKDHGDFIRDGDDLYFIKKLSQLELSKGTAFNITTLDGRKLDCYTQPDTPIDVNTIKWIEGEGMPAKGNLQFRGNLYIIFRPGFGDPLSEGFRMARSWFNKLLEPKLLLKDAPPDKQQHFREYMEAQQAAYEEQMRMAEEMLEQARAERAAARGQPQPQEQVQNQ